MIDPLIDPLIEALLPLLGEPAVASLRGVTRRRPDAAPDAVADVVPPVVRHWPEATAGTDLGAACRDVADRCAPAGVGWTRNGGYRPDSTPPGFLDNYAYLEIVGPDAPLLSTTVRLGFLLLGPSTHYPEHSHPAEEHYVSLGRGWWSRDDEGWRERPATSVIHHPPGCRHAMRTGATPMAAVYLWSGEIETSAVLVR